MSLLLLFGTPPTGPVISDPQVMWTGPFEPGHAAIPSIGQIIGGSVAPFPYRPAVVFYGSTYVVPPAVASQMEMSDPSWWRFL